MCTNTQRWGTGTVASLLLHFACHFLRFCPYVQRARELQISSWFPSPFLTFPIYAFRKVIIWKKSVDMLNTLRHFSCQAISSCHIILFAQRYSHNTIDTMHQFPQVNAKKDEITGTHVKQWMILAEPKHSVWEQNHLLVKHQQVMLTSFMKNTLLYLNRTVVY